MKTQFTTGPWTIDMEDGYIQMNGKPTSCGPAELSTVFTDYEEANANVRLAAAAPDLLAAVESLLQAVSVSNVKGIGLAVDTAQAAIRKALYGQ